MMTHGYLACLGVALALSGCASLQSTGSRHSDTAADSEVRGCVRLFQDIDSKVAKAGVIDGGDARIAGYPYLRATRFLESLKGEIAQPVVFEEWIDLLRQTDLKARGYELRNVPQAALDESVLKQLDRCGQRLVKIDASDDRQRALVRKAIVVPPDYQTWKRVLGIYALARIPFAAGVLGYQRDTEEAFRIPVDQIKVRGKLVRYGPSIKRSESEACTSEPAISALKIPRWCAMNLSRLFDEHAPIFEVDETGDFDRGGALRWDSADRLSVDTSVPMVYRRVGLTRYRDRVLPQLQYALWFPARPKTGAFDLLGGTLDGIVWRVTLDEHGTPLLFDSIHACGCYHQFFPTPVAVLKPRPDSLDEYAFVPQKLSPIERGQRVVIRIASHTHYIERIVVVNETTASDRPYTLADEDDLRSLPSAKGRRSAFRADGIVAGSERGERFLFWPMGIASPGAMRQSGRHATAFVGRRHFDDADLIERYFDLVAQ